MTPPTRQRTVWDVLRRLSTVTAFLLAGIAHLPAAMLIDNFSSATNDRFQNADSPDQFFLSNFDLSGVGLATNGTWGTLIGPNTVISANHAAPSGIITFYANNDPLSTPIELTLSGESTRINGTDLWVGRLTTDAPSSLKIYDYATEQIDTLFNPYALSSYRNKPVYMTGRSPTGGFTTAQSQAYGTNRTSGFVENNTQAGLGSVDALELRYYSSPPTTSYESFFQGGDSGAPLFISNGGELLLLGVNSYISTTDPGGAPVASFVSYTGNDSATIDAFAAQYAAVPEPTTLVLLTLAGLVILGLTKRPTTRAPDQVRVCSGI